MVRAGLRPFAQEQIRLVLFCLGHLEQQRSVAARATTVLAGHDRQELGMRAAQSRLVEWRLVAILSRRPNAAARKAFEIRGDLHHFSFPAGPSGGIDSD